MILKISGGDIGSFAYRLVLGLLIGALTMFLQILRGGQCLVSLPCLRAW